ncbi:Uncharacterised protein [Pseudomonas aeruginosa]|uniref:hypothetical protein n=1 Tax=Pseudomonas aeruginosa TaxID=287 RepID=UPI001EF59922|nr:hypothetical protein [Pseudomonas aeruginosa]CAC9222516.1 Uncharacterised protein [Pseudomonas aeruginosa]
MQKHFTITQAMREEVADRLTLQAVAQHGPRIAADLQALNDQFWSKHNAAAEALPGLDKSTGQTSSLPAHWPPSSSATSTT